MLYQGQFDWKDGCVSNEGWLNALKWSGSEVYSRSRRFIWGRGKTNFGWVKSAKAVNLTEVVVAGAGHMVPMNQPMAALVNTNLKPHMCAFFFIRVMKLLFTFRT